MINVKDKEWLRHAFLLNSSDVRDARDDQNAKYFTEASLKFTATGLGEALCLNPRPQYTEFCDPPVQGLYPQNGGLGQYYSEVHGDNERTIHIRFGVPSFNSIATFLSTCYNSESGYYARTGREPGVFYTIGKLAQVVVLLTSPVMRVVWLLSKLTDIVNFMADNQPSSFYSVKPTMIQFWQATTAIMNRFSANLKITTPMFLKMDSEPKDAQEAEAIAINKRMHDAMPEIYDENGTIDMLMVANRAQIMANDFRERLSNDVKSAGNDIDSIRRAVKGIIDSGVDSSHVPTIKDQTQKWLEGPGGTTFNEKSGKGEDRKSWWEQAKDFYHAERRDGSAFLALRVENWDSSSRSFSNSFQQAPIAEKMNAISKTAQATKFSLAGGNISDDIVTEAVEGFLGAAKDTIAGFSDGTILSGLSTLFGAGYLEAGEMWEQAVADAPTFSYKVELRNPYNNPHSLLLHTFPTLSAILAGCLPRSTGRHTYTYPFYAEVYDRGRGLTRRAMAESVSITRGVGNVAYNRNHHALGITIEVTFKDLSNVLHVPVGNPSFSSAVSGIFELFDDETAFYDYLSSVCALSTSEHIYATRKFDLRATALASQFENIFKPSNVVGSFFTSGWMTLGAASVVRAFSTTSDSLD